MKVRCWMALAAASCALSPGAAIAPGDPAPDLVVRDASGAAVRLSAYREKKHVALLAIPSGHAAAADWQDTGKRLAALDTVLLFLTNDSEASRKFLGDSASATLLIDRAGIVRRRLDGRVLSGAELEQFVDLWVSGKTYFIAYCARCHGEDGDSTLCVTTPLVGVGKKLSPEQIRESLRIGEVNDREVIIRGEIVKRSQLDAIIAYVGGL